MSVSRFTFTWEHESERKGLEEKGKRGTERKERWRKTRKTARTSDVGRV